MRMDTFQQMHEAPLNVVGNVVEDGQDEDD